MSRTVWQEGKHRIVERVDETWTCEDLKGDCFNPDANPDIDKTQLRREEIAFEYEVNDVGVYGYELQVWDAEIGQGWIHVDSCYGFIGQHDASSEKYNHYIVGELKGQVVQGE